MVYTGPAEPPDWLASEVIVCGDGTRRTVRLNPWAWLPDDLTEDDRAWVQQQYELAAPDA